MPWGMMVELLKSLLYEMIDPLCLCLYASKSPSTCLHTARNQVPPSENGRLGVCREPRAMWRMSGHTGGSVPLPAHRLVAVGLWLREVGVN